MFYSIVNITHTIVPFGFQIVHHSLSAIAVAYAMFTGEGQLYTFMVLISEVTTPEINMRWYVLASENLIKIWAAYLTSIWVSCRYLDTAGLKRSNAYLINGVVIFFAWLVSHIHSYSHFRWTN